MWRVTGSEDAVTGAARSQALRAQRTHPTILWFGPAYGAMELTDGGWLMSDMTTHMPQDVRDGLGWHFRRRALRRSTAEAARESYWEASARLEEERLNDLTVAGRRLRVVRADRFLRHNLSGPEGPRPSDPEEPPKTWPGLRAEDLDGMTAGLLGWGHPPGSEPLLGEHWEAVPDGLMVPEDVTRDARDALTAYPRIVLLPARFAVLEERHGYWSALTSGTAATPSGARDTLANYCELGAPMLLPLTERECAVYREGAQHVRAGHMNDLTVAGRRFRVARVETTVRVGPNGPEPSRPSDYDPQPPLKGETAELRTWNLRDE